MVQDTHYFLVIAIYLKKMMIFSIFFNNKQNFSVLKRQIFIFLTTYFLNHLNT